MSGTLEATSAVLRFDDVPLEDFLLALARHEQDVRPGFLPRAGHLKEACFSGRIGGPAGVPVRLYLLQETEALSQVTETFLVLAGPGGEGALLRDTALALRDFLKGVGEPALFRVDPRYGVAFGSSMEPVDPTVRWDRPGAYLTLYLTADPASPSLAVVEYVAAEHMKRYRELFERYNGLAPSKPSFLGGAFRKLTGPAPPPVGQGKVHYRTLKHLARFFQTRGLCDAKVSLIFRGVGPDELPSCLLDPSLRVEGGARIDRFLPSLAELA